MIKSHLSLFSFLVQTFEVPSEEPWPDPESLRRRLWFPAVVSSSAPVRPGLRPIWGSFSCVSSGTLWSSALAPVGAAGSARVPAPHLAGCSFLSSVLPVVHVNHFFFMCFAWFSGFSYWTVNLSWREKPLLLFFFFLNEKGEMHAFLFGRHVSDGFLLL